MNIEHGDYAFQKAELQAFDTPSIEDRAIRLLQDTIEDYKRLMRDVVQATTVEQKLAAESAIERRLKE